MVPGGVDCSLQPCFFNKSSSYENNYSFNSTSDADVLNEIMTCTKKGGTISIIAHHNGFNYISMEKHTSIIIGQSDTQKHQTMCLNKIRSNKVDPRFVVTNNIKINELSEHYQQLSVEETGTLICFIRI